MADVSVYVALISAGAAVAGATISQFASAIRDSRQAKRDRQERYEDATLQACVQLLEAAGELRAQVENNFEYHGDEMAARLAQVRQYAGATQVHAASVALQVPEKLGGLAEQVAAAASRLALVTAEKTNLRLGGMDELPNFGELDDNVKAFRRDAITDIRRGARSVNQQPPRLPKVRRRQRGIGRVDGASG
jgi:hypothetical protein